MAARRRSSGGRGRRGGLNIKIKRPGAFTRKAKAAGRGVQAHARAVMSAPKGRYSALTRRQANFALVAAKWAKPKKGSTKAKRSGRKAAASRRRRS
jgi:hypothetical protein